MSSGRLARIQPHFPVVILSRYDESHGRSTWTFWSLVDGDPTYSKRLSGSSHRWRLGTTVADSTIAFARTRTPTAPMSSSNEHCKLLLEALLPSPSAPIEPVDEVLSWLTGWMAGSRLVLGDLGRKAWFPCLREYMGRETTYRVIFCCEAAYDVDGCLSAST